MQETIAVQEGEYVFGQDDDQLRYTGDALVLEDDDDRSVDDGIALEDVTDVRTVVDKSVAGFRMIGIALGLFALLFTGITVQMVLDGARINMVTAGTGLSAAFGWLGAVQYYRAERGTVTGVVVETSDDEFVFYTRSDEEAVDGLVKAIRTHDGRPVEAAPGATPR